MRFSLFVVLVWIQFPLFSYSQSSIVSSGDDFDSEDGSLSFSLGLVGINYVESEDLSVSEGIQHTYELVPNGDSKSPIDVLIYPNPTVDIIYLEFIDEDITDMYYEVRDMVGRILLSEPVKLPKLSFSMEPYAEGTYILNVIKYNKNVTGFKIIKNIR